MTNSMEEAARQMIEEAAALSEALRSSTIKRLAIRDNNKSQAALADVIALASHVFDAPIATMTFLEDKVAFVKAACGVPAGDYDRELSFCDKGTHTSDMMIVPNAHLDDRFKNNPYVIDGTVGFYLGQPLITQDQVHLGALCVIAHEPREVPYKDLDCLRALARLAMRIIES